MTIHGWKTRFIEIRREFGYSEREDLRSVKKLNSILKNKASKKQLQEIAETKLPDLNTRNVEAAMRIIEGTAKNMGITISD